jgi:MOSC domain-containing protein YiiM
MSDGRIEAIFLAQPEVGERLEVQEARARAGIGLEGDAFAEGGARQKDRANSVRDITLIEAEAIEALAEETGIALEQREPRRNVVTRGMSLNDLVGRRFTVGEAECIGRELNEPCAHLESLTQPGVLKGLVHRGGIRADIVGDGTFRVGDAVRPLDGAA